MIDFKYMKWLSIFSDKNKSVKPTKTRQPQASEVKRVADRALKQYDKTFKDLARYDKGEEFLNAVS